MSSRVAKRCVGHKTTKAQAHAQQSNEEQSITEEPTFSAQLESETIYFCIGGPVMTKGHRLEDAAIC